MQICIRIIKTLIFSVVIAHLPSAPALAIGEVWDVAADPTNGFGGSTPSWSLSESGSAYAAWNAFNSYPTDSTPDAGSFGLGTAAVTEHTGASFVTGGGNIYSFSQASDFSLTLSGLTTNSGGYRTIALRIETLGNPLDALGVTLSTNGTSIAPDTSTMLFEDLAGAGGLEQESLFIWENVLDGDYTLDFGALASSMSLSQVAAYASPTVVPEPGTALLMLLGLAGLSVAGNKRSVQSGE